MDSPSCLMVLDQHVQDESRVNGLTFPAAGILGNLPNQISERLEDFAINQTCRMNVLGIQTAQKW